MKSESYLVNWTTEQTNVYIVLQQAQLSLKLHIRNTKKIITNHKGKVMVKNKQD